MGPENEWFILAQEGLSKNLNVVLHCLICGIPLWLFYRVSSFTRHHTRSYASQSQSSTESSTTPHYTEAGTYFYPGNEICTGRVAPQRPYSGDSKK